MSIVHFLGDPADEDHMGHESRIGERFELDAVDVTWAPRVSTEWAERVRRAKGGSDLAEGHGVRRSTAARLCNVSVSGAGVVAPADEAVREGTLVEVGVGPGSGFVARICRILPGDSLGWAYFGVEYTEMTDAYRQWLNHVIATHRAPQRS